MTLTFVVSSEKFAVSTGEDLPPKLHLNIPTCQRFTRLGSCLSFKTLSSLNPFAILLQQTEQNQKPDANAWASFYLWHIFATKGLPFGPYSSTSTN